MIVEKRNWVKLMLIKYPKLRDSNERLYYLHLKELGYNIESKTAKDLLMDMEKRKIPYLDSIARTSRLIQEEFPHLRGETWGKRKQKAVKIKHEIIASK